MRIEPCSTYEEMITLYRWIRSEGFAVRILTPRAHGMWALMVTL